MGGKHFPVGVYVPGSWVCFKTVPGHEVVAGDDNERSFSMVMETRAGAGMP